MSQEVILQVLLLLLVFVVYVIYAIRKSSNFQELKPIEKKFPRAVPGRAIKPITQSDEVYAAWEKEDPSYGLHKSSISRAKKVLNRSLLKRSILTNEILRKKY